jgi:hypothetical protein
MMQGGWPTDLSSLSILLIGVATFAAMTVAALAGQLLRRWHAKRSRLKDLESGESVAQEGYLLGSVLGLLGLLMAFSFGMVLNRYEARRELVVDEANAIGTAYLRAQLLDEPHRSRLSSLLVDYTANRIRLASGDRDSGAYLARNDQLLTEIWAAVRASRESAVAHGLTTALLNTVNEVIDLDAKRKLAWELRLPVEVVALLFAYLVITAAVVGHQIDGPRGRRAALLLFVAVALSLTVIVDINRPMTGHERESQKAMLALLQSLRAQPPHVFDQFATAAEGVRR